MHPRAKILSLEQMDKWVATQKAAGWRLGFTCGAFDLMHAGHAQYLAAAREKCDRLIVAVNSDASVRRYKSPLRPINAQDQRMFLVAALQAVDAVTLMEEDRPLSLLVRWKPDLYIKGGDYSADSLKSGDAVREYGGSVIVIKPEFGSSSTAIIDRIAAIAAHAEPERRQDRLPYKGLVLLDRDATLINEARILPGVVEGLEKLQAAQLRLAIITNQQAIGLGYYSIQDFIAVNQRLFRELGPHGIRISRVYFCPHSMAEECDCRKPAAGMILRAMREFETPPDRTVVIGDSDVDIEAARAAGVRAWQVKPGGFLEAAEAIISAISSRDIA